MNKLGILASDLSAFYLLGQVRAGRPDLDIDLIYDPVDYFQARDPEWVAAYLDKNIRRFKSLGIDRPLVAREAWTPQGLWHWEGLVAQLVQEEAPQGMVLLKSQGGQGVLESPIFFLTALDGLMQRTFSLEILRAYLDLLPPGTRSLVLASPSYGYWHREIGAWARDRGIRVYDPLDRLLRTWDPTERGQGRVRYFWTERDFDIERRVGEVLQEEVRFSTYYSHPWLRGEGIKKRPSFGEWVQELRDKKKTSDH